MTAKEIIVALSVIAVLGAVAAMAALSLTAAPTAARGQPQTEATPLPPPPPTPTLDPAADEDVETLAQLKKYCHDGAVYDLYATVADADEGQGKTVSLEWWADLHYWELSEEETLVYYRIERQSHARDAPTGEQWQVVDTVHTTNVWSGPVETGHWHYRVRLIGLVSGDLIHECQETKWAETEVNVLTPQEELAHACESTYVYYVAAWVEPTSDGQGETVALEWQLDHYYYHGYTTPPDDAVLTYKIERASDYPGSESNWETVAEVSDKNTWNGPAEPGKWIYRVALVSLQAGDLAAQCEKPQWAETNVLWIPTAEELAQEKNDRRVLAEQLTTCATDALTTNLTPAAREVVGRHIERRVSEITEDYGSQDMIPMVVMFCTEAEGGLFFGDNTAYILRTLFDYDDYYW